MAGSPTFPRQGNRHIDTRARGFPRGVGRQSAALDEARRKSETGGPGPQSTYCEAMARIVCARHAHGETLPAICRDPLMPPLSTVISWSRHNEGFRKTLSAAREAHADMITEHSLELLETTDPKDAKLLSVRLGHLRWLAGIRSPRSHGRVRAASVV